MCAINWIGTENIGGQKVLTLDFPGFCGQKITITDIKFFSDNGSSSQHERHTFYPSTFNTRHSFHLPHTEAYYTRMTFLIKVRDGQSWNVSVNLLTKDIKIAENDFKVF